MFIRSISVVAALALATLSSAAPSVSKSANQATSTSSTHGNDKVGSLYDAYNNGYDQFSNQCSQIVDVQFSASFDFSAAVTDISSNFQSTIDGFPSSYSDHSDYEQSSTVAINLVVKFAETVQILKTNANHYNYGFSNYGGTIGPAVCRFYETFTATFSETDISSAFSPYESLFSEVEFSAHFSDCGN